MPAPIHPFLFKYSEEKHDLSLMLEEWSIRQREMSEELCNCPCGKKGIRELVWIRNKLNGEVFFIGNCCAKQISETNGYCSFYLCPYQCVSHASHFCNYHARNRNDAPTGRISKGKWQGTPYNSPTLDKYKMWAMENKTYCDKHYIAYLELERTRKIEALVLEAKRRRTRLENGSLEA